MEKLRSFFDRKWTGLMVLLFISLAFGALIAYNGAVAGAGIIALMIGPPAVYAIVAFPAFGITILLILAYLLFFVSRLGIDFPLGTVMDGIQGLLILRFFIHETQTQLEDFQGAHQRHDCDLDRLQLIQVANPRRRNRASHGFIPFVR